MLFPFWPLLRVKTMMSIRKWLDFFTPNSPFGITFATFAVFGGLVLFFSRDLQLVSLNASLDSNSGFLADRPLLLPSSGAKCEREHKRFSSDSCLLEDASEDVAAFDSLTMDALAASSVSIQPAGPYSSSHSSLPMDVASRRVALLGRTTDCRWADNARSLREGAPIHVGQTLQVAAGLIEIVFGCGATAVIEGPAVFEVESEKSSTLRLGRLTAQVPDQVEGFVVHTPSIQLVSLCRLESQGVAKVTGMSNCRWGSVDREMQEGACLLPGRELKLAEGLAEITFSSGAKVILQGPAHLQIESSKSATLLDGRLTADVPDNIHDFKIHTSVAEIVSLPSDEAVTKAPANTVGK
jgi:hypothetical protein